MLELLGYVDLPAHAKVAAASTMLRSTAVGGASTSPIPPTMPST